ncbi:MAG: MbnP family protein [Ferruginibacter sp.]
MKRILFPVFSAIILLASCKKEDAPQYNSAVLADLSVEFDNVAGASDLQLNTATYTNAAGESFNITKVKYYVSNFVLTNMNGTVYTVPQDSCYFLIDESDASTHEPELKVPEGEYKTLTFTVGVDSLRNTMDVSKRTGALDLTGAGADMYWSWNSGYIFFKMDGTSPVIASGTNVFQYHIGGFGGYTNATTNNLKTITLDLTARGVPQVKAGKETNIHLFVDVLKALNGSTNMSFANIPMIHSPTAGQPVANNYTAMFKHDHTEN